MLISFGAGWTSLGRRLKNNGKMLQSYGLWLDDWEFNVCQIDVLYGKSLIIDFLDDFLKKRTAILSVCIIDICHQMIIHHINIILQKKNDLSSCTLIEPNY